MTHETDFIRVRFEMVGETNLLVHQLPFEWPPPEKIYLSEHGLREFREGDEESLSLVRTSMSVISDEDAAEMDYFARGAVYEYAKLQEDHDA